MSVGVGAFDDPYKNIIAFCSGRRGRRPLPICEKFDILIVGTGVPDGPRAIHESPLRVW